MNASVRLLVIEDDRTVSVWLTTLFRRFGFSVHLAEDGLAGLTMARQLRPDLIILDYNLPKADGGFVLTTLRKDASSEEMGIIMLSGEQDLDTDALLEAGADAFLPKHTEGIALLNTVRTVLENRGSFRRTGTWG